MATNSRKNSGVRPTGERHQNADNIDAYSHLKEMGEGIASTLAPFGMSYISLAAVVLKSPEAATGSGLGSPSRE